MSTDNPTLPIRVEVNEGFLETFGTGYSLSSLKEVTLVFPRSTRGWLERNGGPHQYIVNEYTIQCLVEDVLRLQEMGTSVKVETILQDPKP